MKTITKKVSLFFLSIVAMFCVAFSFVCMKTKKVFADTYTKSADHTEMGITCGYNDLISFDVYPTGEDRTLNFCIIQNWGAYRGYYTVTLANGEMSTNNGAFVTEKADGGYTVAVLLNKGGNNQATAESQFNCFYMTTGNSGSTNYYVTNFQVVAKNVTDYQYFKTGVGPTDTTKDYTGKAGLSFIYKMADPTKKLTIGMGNSGTYYGYFDLNGAPTVAKAYDGVYLQKLENGYVKATGFFDQVKRANSATKADPIGVVNPFNRIYVHASWTTGAGFYYGMEAFDAYYSVNVENGTKNTTMEYIPSNESVTVTANEPEMGYVFDSWKENEEIVSTDATYSFTPTKDVVLTATYKKEAVQGAFKMKTGASVRLNEPYGIRFACGIHESVYDETAVYGMIIIPNDYVEYFGLENAYVETLTAKNVAFRNFICTPVKDGDNYFIQASLTNILAVNLERDFIGIAYVLKDGVYTYAESNNNVRSIAYVAEKAIEDTPTFESYTSEQKSYLKSMLGYTSNIDLPNDGSYFMDTKASKDQVIEFTFRKNTSGNIKFALLDNNDWDTGYYGYYTIDSSNMSKDIGVQVIPVGNDWTYVANENDNITAEWYKVVIDIQSLTKYFGNVSGYEGFDTLYFPSKQQGVQFDIKNVIIRDRTLQDGTYYSKCNNCSTVEDYTFTTIDVTGKTQCVFYVKQAGNVGGNEFRIYLKGADNAYVTINTSTKTTNVAYVSVTEVVEDEYVGWLKVTYDFNAKVPTGNITGFYTRYSKGEFFVGGFKAE